LFLQVKNKRAAFMHLTTTNCTQLKIITDKAQSATSKRANNKKISMLYYLHKKVPILNTNFYQFNNKENYIGDEFGEWRPVSSLASSSISRRLFKLKWEHNKKLDNDNNNQKQLFLVWKLSVLESLNNIIKSPPLEMLENKKYIFYSKILNNYIPRYVLKDLHLLEQIKKKEEAQSAEKKLPTNNNNENLSFDNNPRKKLKTKS
jgi:hypothetical protein